MHTRRVRSVCNISVHTSEAFGRRGQEVRTRITSQGGGHMGCARPGDRGPGGGGGMLCAPRGTWGGHTKAWRELSIEN